MRGGRIEGGLKKTKIKETDKKKGKT